jgi:selenocysteine lyase/cysteine desulfurase
VPDDEAIVDAIDERTLLVPVTHVLFKTAEIQDVEAIVRRAHEVGAHVVLDAYQSAGIVRSTSPRWTWTSRSAAASNGCAAGRATAGST